MSDWRERDLQSVVNGAGLKSSKLDVVVRSSYYRVPRGTPTNILYASRAERKKAGLPK